MCYFPRRLYNPVRSVSPGTQYYLDVPCGECEACKNKKRMEYKFRSYYEMQSTFNQDGYVYFDTLTYRSKDLPHLSDFLDEVSSDAHYNFPCFNSKHVNVFFHRLREELKRAGYDVAGRLKYFLSCEYGLDERYTHRPHYHVLFFVTAALPPLVLSSLVSKSWLYGITDGLPYQPVGYVLNHVYNRDSRFDSDTVTKVCSYVSKYVSKDSSFTNLVESRICSVLSHVDIPEHLRKDFQRSLNRQILPFHRQSQSFGGEFLKFNDIDVIERSGVIRMPSGTTGVFLEMPLPTYYKRKLYYDLVTDSDGYRHWCLNEAGNLHNRRYVRYVCARLAKTFSDWFLGLLPVQKSYVSYLLGERSWSDFAEYMTFYRGRVIPVQVLNERAVDGCYSVPSVDEMIEHMYSSGAARLFYNYATPAALKHFGKTFLSSSNLGTSQSDFVNKVSEMLAVEEMVDGSVSIPPVFYSLADARDVIDCDYFVKHYLFDEHFCPKWLHFDKLYSYFCSVNFNFNKNKNLAQQHKFNFQRYINKIYASQ